MKVLGTIEEDLKNKKDKYNEAIEDLHRVVKTFTRDLKHHAPKEEWLIYGVK